LFVALALCFGTSCIFSPEAGEIPPAPPPTIENAADLIEALSRAYQQRDDKLFAKLLANDPENNAEYLFLLSDPTPENETQWGYSEEVRIHQRMFHPEAPLPGDTPVPPEIWLQSLTITLTPETAFSERTDLYTTEGGYLDPAKWRATSATYGTYLLFELAGETDYRVEGRADFVVIEDRTKDVGDDGKFLLLIWEDLGSAGKPDASQNPA
jgi:hypothetical protein